MEPSVSTPVYQNFINGHFLANQSGETFDVTNPATGEVTVSINANGDAALKVVDITGKVAMNGATFNPSTTLFVIDLFSNELSFFPSCHPSSISSSVEKS